MPASKDSAVPLFQTTKPFDIPVSTWLFYIRGLDSLFDYGIPLLDVNMMVLLEDNIYKNLKYFRIQTSSELQNLQQQLAEAISTTGEKITDKPTIKYIIVDCVYCNSEGVVNNDFVNNLQKQFNTTIQQVVARDPKVLALSLTTPSIHHRQRRAVAVCIVFKSNEH
ncbi:unnamed protein product [Didymodactylos carnosus]|uniref:Uncharacterized protein n=1 Tax=Didymodactylos carnosus TaxID=1234261 RepID=A0A813YWT4_9BILA|nr:unnamed protein product [Didymodactylos carnosus]CAF1101660.1 unnamed protein product [Didymodactylos carnosus]CAF3674684.1 unnamed protein product [Didymodactylos carnosus]CAF3862993.1 unnamed protein product [Didymodactylos carnosus]